MNESWRPKELDNNRPAIGAAFDISWILQSQGLTQEQRKDLEKRAEELDAQLKEKADDVDALKESADLAAVLGDLKKSSSLAERVTKAEPSNARAWLAVVGSDLSC